MMGGGSSTTGGSGVVIPPNQEQVAGQLGQITGPLANLSMNAGAGTPGGWAYPQGQYAYNQYLNDPATLSQAQSGAQTAATAGFGQLWPQATLGSSNLYNQAIQSLPYGNNILGNAFDPLYGSTVSALQQNPYYNTALQGALAANTLGSEGSNEIGSLAGTVNAAATNPMWGNLAGYAESNPYAAGALTGAQTAAGFGAGGAQSLYDSGNQLLASGFDPQHALFSRTQQQLTDQSNAINAMSGLAGTPYGSSVTANALGNFDINWQNNQLNRQAQAAGAASPLLQSAPGLAAGSAALPSQSYLGQLNAITPFLQNQLGAATQGLGAASGAYPIATNLLTSSSAAPSNTYGNYYQNILSALGSRNQAGLQGATGLQNLLGAAGSGLTGAQNLGYGGATQLAQLSALPYQTGTTAAQNELAGLGNVVNLGNQQFVLPQQMISDFMQYMGLGQSASSLASAIQGQNFNQLSQGIGGGISALGGINSLTGGGITNALGLGGGLGGLGTMAGGESAIGGDLGAALASSGLAADASGGAGIGTLAGIAPLAVS